MLTHSREIIKSNMVIVRDAKADEMLFRTKHE